MTDYLLKDVDVLGQGVRDVAITHDNIVEPTQAHYPLVLNCAGLIALPALVDPHTHLREPGAADNDDIATGSAAAAKGGYGAVFAMANTNPVADSAEVVEYVKRRSDETGLVDVHPVGAVTKGLGGRQLADITGMASSRAHVRLFSDDGRCIAASDLMRAALKAVRDVKGILAQHAQDPALTKDAQVDANIAERVGLPAWPAAAEATIVARDVLMAAELNAKLHVCHVSTAQTVAVLRWAKSQAMPVTAEVTPHHLALTNEAALSGDPLYKVNPPLRSQADVDAVRVGLVDGTLDMVGTDHAPHPPATKHVDWCHASMGMLGLETALAVVAEQLVHTGHMSWATLADRMSTSAAGILGISADHGGTLAPGRPATLCLVDPHRPWTVTRTDLASRSDNTPYEGRQLNARVVATLLRGKVTYDLDHRFSTH